MSLKNTLLNTHTPTGDLSALQGEWLVVAEARGRLPLPWLCLFAPEDLQACTLTWLEPGTHQGETRQFVRKGTLRSPAVSVAVARERLSRAKPAFDRLTREARHAEKHWRQAMAALDELPLPYVVLDPTALARSAGAQGAALLAQALVAGDAGLAARRELARLDVDASDDENFDGLDGGFRAPAEHLRRTRSDDEVMKLRRLVLALDTHRLMQTPKGFQPLPLETPSQHPPERFWEDAAAMARGRAAVEATQGDYAWIGERCYGGSTFTNRTRERLRVVQFSAFERDGQGGYGMLSASGEWMPGALFNQSHQLPEDAWIEPGQTVAHPDDWTQERVAMWAWWCETERGDRFMATLMQRPPVGDGSVQIIDGRAVSRMKAPYQPITPAVRHTLDRQIEIVRDWLKSKWNRDLTLDGAGVKLLDELCEQQHEVAEPDDHPALVPMIGAVLGECVARSIGGQWMTYDEILCVRQGESTHFPFFKVGKHLANGRAGGDSIAGFHDSITRMAPRALTARQVRFRDLCFEQAGKGWRFEVGSGSGAERTWARVTATDGTWFAIDFHPDQPKDPNAPTAKARLDTLQALRVTNAEGQEIDLGPGDPVEVTTPAARPAPAAESSHPEEPALAAALDALRQTHDARRATLNPIRLELMSGARPTWMKDSDGLVEIFRNQSLLLKEGRIHWAALVQANNLLFKPGPADCPAQVIHSPDPWFDAHPSALRALAHRLYQLKNTKPDDPVERAIAARVSNEMDRTMGWPLPAELTPREVSSAAIMVFRRHLPGGVLHGTRFPVLVHPSTKAVLMVPAEFWPAELVAAWKEGRL